MNASTVKTRHVPLLDLTAQHSQIRETVLAALIKVVDSQKFILGEEVQKLEQELADYCHCRFAVGCASGSDALILALMAAEIGPGDQVVTTPYSFFATAGAISRVGATPVFADIDPETFNIDPAQVAHACETHDRVRAIIPVHLFGASADMDSMLEIALKHNLAVIEDAAQAIGAEYKGRRIGSLSHIGCFSFFPSKNLGGYGDGGMLTTNNAGLAERLRALRIHGRTGKYIHEWIGINSRLDALQAAVLRVKLRYLDEWSRRRAENAALYRRLLVDAGLPVTPPQVTSYQTRHVYNQFAIRCQKRDGLQSYLKEAGVGTEVYYPLPLHLQKCFAGLSYEPGDFPVSEKLAGESLALPVNPDISFDDVEYVCGAIRDFYA